MALDDPVDLLLLGGYELQDHDLQQLGGAKNTLTDLVVATEDTAEDPTADWFKNLEDFLKTHKPIGIKASVLIYESESESDSESDSESEPKLKSKVKLGGGRRPKTDNTNTISSNIVLHSWHGMSKKQPQIMDYQSGEKTVIGKKTPRYSRGIFEHKVPARGNRKSAVPAGGAVL